MSDIQMIKHRFFEHKVSVQIPDCYQEMEAETVEVMFPYEDRPQIILSDPSGTRFCTFSYLKDQKMTQAQTAYAIREIVQIVTSLYPSSLIQEPKVMTLPDGKLEWFEYKTMKSNGGIHNFIYVFSEEGSMLLGTMGCDMEDMDGIAELKNIMGSMERIKKHSVFPGVKR